MEDSSACDIHSHWADHVKACERLMRTEIAGIGNGRLSIVYIAIDNFRERFGSQMYKKIALMATAKVEMVWAERASLAKMA
jgi:hypothetical protein